MQEKIAIYMLVASTLKLVFVIFSGVILIYFGYRLFYIAQSNAGNLEIESKYGKFRLISAAPGVFLTLFGSVVLIFALARESHVNFDSNNTDISFGSIASIGLDYEAGCANITNWSLGFVKSSQEYLAATGGKKLTFDGKIAELEIVLARCVDSKFGEGAFSTYLSVKKKVEHGDEVPNDKKTKDIYLSVSGMLDD